jgi:Zn-dependent protease with chaperone function/uncharacterized tellurite resistance protein B-like protein
MTGAATFVAERDRVLREELLQDSGVRLALRKIDQRTSGYGLRTRRNLLTSGLRLTRSIAPRVHVALAACREALGFDREVELYVKPDPSLNAFCTRSIVGPAIVGFSSRLIETFSDAELRFVLGHELGHAMLDHFAIPMPLAATIEDVGGKFVSRAVQLKLYLWCRAAEVSADRAGALCARDPNAAAFALLKIASGLGEGHIVADLTSFSAQVDALVATPAACANERDQEYVLDCFDTHPYSPLRVRALVAFARSKAYQSATGSAPIGLDDSELEAIVHGDLAVMDPSYLEDSSGDSEAARRLLYCAGVSVARADGTIDSTEVRALRALLGAKKTEVPDEKTELETIATELEQRLADVSQIPFATRVQLVSHLTVIAAADGVVAPAELAEILRISERLGVEPRVVDQTLAGAAAPMD